MSASRALAAVVGASLILASTMSVHAATVEGAEGAISINRGDGFIAGGARMDVEPGTQVMVVPGQTAVITYPGECRVRIGAGRVWTVEQIAPCPPGQPEIDYSRLASDLQPSNIVTGQVADPNVVNTNAGGGGFLGGGGLVTGAVVGGAAIAVAVGVGLSASKSSKSSSP